MKSLLKGQPAFLFLVLYELDTNISNSQKATSAMAVQKLRGKILKTIILSFF